jgi:BSD domain
MIDRLRKEAARRLKEVQRAEDAADEALAKFGSNIGSLLRDAVTIAPPSDEANKDGSPSQLLFESKDSDGRRIIHTSRFDAQLHVIHSSLDSFLKDPESKEYAKFSEGFDVEKKTEEIANDLEKYPELRTAMEKCVPEKADYSAFWRRYYFLKGVVEYEEERRKELLKGMVVFCPNYQK